MVIAGDNTPEPENALATLWIQTYIYGHLIYQIPFRQDHKNYQLISFRYPDLSIRGLQYIYTYSSLALLIACIGVFSGNQFLPSHRFCNHD